MWIHHIKIWRVFYPEKQTSDDALCQAEGRPEVAIECSIHHARIHGTWAQRGTSTLQLLVEVGTKQQLGQLTVTISSVGRITLAVEREREWQSVILLHQTWLHLNLTRTVQFYSIHSDQLLPQSLTFFPRKKNLFCWTRTNSSYSENFNKTSLNPLAEWAHLVNKDTQRHWCDASESRHWHHRSTAQPQCQKCIKL